MGEPTHRPVLAGPNKNSLAGARDCSRGPTKEFFSEGHPAALSGAYPLYRGLGESNVRGVDSALVQYRTQRCTQLFASPSKDMDQRKELVSDANNSSNEKTANVSSTSKSTPVPI